MPERFGRYWLHERIGQGGMAEVFRATIGPDPETYSFELALKRLKPELQKDPAQVEMFLTEADVAKLLRHPNIVQVYDSGSIDGRAYIAMEYVRGFDLATLIAELRKRRLRFPSDLAVFVALQVLRALDYIHGACSKAGESMEIIHRDVTPSNVYVTFGGEVKLGDFGVARIKFLESFDESRFLKGKAAYMPPEVLSGEPIGQTLDLWSLAATLYEMLTARRLFDSVSEADLATGNFKPHIAPVHTVNTDISSDLSKILQRALSPKPKKRPQDATELYRQLKSHLVANGITVDATALSRFVTAVSGVRPGAGPVRPGAAAPGSFETPAYQVPLGWSPTQRFEQRARRRRLVGPLLAVGAIAVLAVASFFVASRRPAAPVVASPAPPAPAAPAPARESEKPPEQTVAESRDRPAVPPELAFDFSDEEGALDLTAEKATPARWKSLVQKARTLSKKRRFVAADEAFRQALEIRPRHIPSLLGRADALLELRRYQEAEQLVRGALSLAPKEARVHLLLGDVLWVQGKGDLAKQEYTRCVELDPGGKAASTAKKILSNL